MEEGSVVIPELIKQSSKAGRKRMHTILPSHDAQYIIRNLQNYTDSGKLNNRYVPVTKFMGDFKKSQSEVK